MKNTEMSADELTRRIDALVRIYHVATEYNDESLLTRTREQLIKLISTMRQVSLL